MPSPRPADGDDVTLAPDVREFADSERGDAQPTTETSFEPAAEPAEAGQAAIKLSPAARVAGDACVQCGLCLPACPTYLETASEADSPRGRIRIMLGLDTGEVPATDAATEHLDRCLGCRACETACPSGVSYHTLFDEARNKLAHDRVDGGKPEKPLSRVQRAVFLGLLARPNRLRASLAVARLSDRVGLRKIARKLGLTSLLGPTLKRMDQLLPSDDGAAIWPKPLPAHSRAGGMDMVVTMLDPGRADDAGTVQTVVAFFEGCVAGVMAPDVHQKAAELLCYAGADVISPPDQVCCGAIHQHAGEGDQARNLARSNIDTYLPDRGPEPTYITTCTAGDGAMLRGYGELLAGDSRYAKRAKRFSELVRDVTEVLQELGVGQGDNAFEYDVPLRAAYHDACHLAHAQRVTSPPREMLSRVPGLELVALPESDVCCGAAGTYNLTQPEMATQLAERKLANFEPLEADVLVSGNIGCTMHLAATATNQQRPVKIVHPVELLHAAAFGA